MQADLRNVRKRLSQAAIDLEKSNRDRFMYASLAMVAALVFLYCNPEIGSPEDHSLREALQPALALYAWGQMAVLLAPLVSCGGIPREADLPEKAKKTARSLRLSESAEQALRMARTCEDVIRRNRRQVLFFMALLIGGLSCTLIAKIAVLRTVCGV